MAPTSSQLPSPPLIQIKRSNSDCDSDGDDQPVSKRAREYPRLSSVTRTSPTPPDPAAATANPPQFRPDASLTYETTDGYGRITRIDTWIVHKAVLRMHSNYFAASKTKFVFKDFVGGSRVFKNFVEYIYDETYPLHYSTINGPFRVSAGIYCLAQELNMKDLGDLAVAKMRALAFSKWKTKDFADVVDISYNGFSPKLKADDHRLSGFREHVLSMIAANFQDIRSSYDHEDGQHLRKVFDKTPVILWDVCNRSATRSSEAKE